MARLPLVTCAALWACAAAQVPDKALVRQPETAADFLIGCLKAAKYDYAHQAISPDAHLKMEELIMAFESYPTLRRLVGATATVNVHTQDDRGTATLHNPLMGLTLQVGLKKEFGTVWTVRLPSRESLAEKGKIWLARQWEDELSRTLLPPDGRFKACAPNDYPR